MTNEFWSGVLVGVLSFAAFAFLATQYAWISGRVGRFFRPQSITLQTKDTPAEIFRGCVEAILRLLFVLVLLFAVWLLFQYWYG